MYEHRLKVARMIGWLVLTPHLPRLEEDVAFPHAPEHMQELHEAC